MMKVAAVVCGAICPYRAEKEVGQPWVQRSFFTAGDAQRVGWRLVSQLGPQGPQVVWACPECALELGVIARLEGGYRSALTILETHDGIMSTLAFSETRWPERAMVGKGWNMAATGLLGRLVKLALVECVYAPKLDRKGTIKRSIIKRLQGYSITYAGRNALQDGRYDVPKEVQKERAARWAESRRLAERRRGAEVERSQGRPGFTMVYA